MYKQGVRTKEAKGPIHPQKSPTYPQKSPVYLQKSPVYPQNSPTYPQKSPVYLQKSPVYPQKSGVQITVQQQHWRHKKSIDMESDLLRRLDDRESLHKDVSPW